MRRGSHVTILALTLILTGAIAFPMIGTGQSAQAEQVQMDRRLLVNGEAEVEVTPDIAEVTVGVETEAATAALAQQQNARIMASVVDAVKKADVAREDIQTSGYSLSPIQVYDEGLHREKLVGYRSSNQLRATVRELESVGKLIDAAVRAGATNVEGVLFSVTDKSAWEKRALEKAIADAQSKAKAMAQAAGVMLGRPVTISASLAPVPLDRPMRAMYAKATETATPVEPGKIKIRASVQMTFEI